MSVQIRNPELVRLLAADFVRRNDTIYMMVKTSVDSGDTLTIPAGWQQLAWGTYTVSGTLETGGEMVIL